MNQNKVAFTSSTETNPLLIAPESALESCTSTRSITTIKNRVERDL